MKLKPRYDCFQKQFSTLYQTVGSQHEKPLGWWEGATPLTSRCSSRDQRDLEGTIHQILFYAKLYRKSFNALKTVLLRVVLMYLFFLFFFPNGLNLTTQDEVGIEYKEYLKWQIFWEINFIQFNQWKEYWLAVLLALSNRHNECNKKFKGVTAK